MRYYGCKEKLLDFIDPSIEKIGINLGLSVIYSVERQDFRKSLRE